MADPIDANSLMLIHAIASAGSLTRAAQNMGMVQPALTKRLQRIESQLGVNLFTRDRRGVRLTPYGDTLLPHANTLVAQLRQATEAVGQMRGLREGIVSVALSHLATITLLGEAYRRFQTLWPGIQLRIAPPAFPDRFTGLREGAPDFAVVSRPAQRLGNEFISTPLHTTTVVAIARVGHPLVQARTLGQLVDAQWVLPNVSSTSAQALAQVFSLARLKAPRIAAICETLTGLEILVSGSDLIGIVPAEVHVLRAEASGLVALPLDTPIEGPSLALIRWREAQPTPAAAALEQIFIQVAHERARSEYREKAG
jgi:LysR family transcriptional regulator of abg operon